MAADEVGGSQEDDSTTLRLGTIRKSVNPSSICLPSPRAKSEVASAQGVSDGPLQSPYDLTTFSKAVGLKAGRSPYEV